MRSATQKNRIGVQGLALLRPAPPSLVLAFFCVVSLGLGALAPFGAQAGYTSEIMIPQPLRGSRVSPPEHTLPFSVFRSAVAKDLCVTVVNLGPGHTTVRLLRKDNLVGRFTVVSQSISAMCSTATTIELRCSTAACKTLWKVLEDD